MIALGDKRANMKNTYKYYAFGSDKEKIELLPNRYRYTCREYNSENRLYYYRTRIYNPIDGRFAQKDKYSAILLLKKNIYEAKKASYI